MARARRVEIVIGGDASGAARAFGTAGASAKRFEGQVKRSSAISTAAFRAMRIGAIGLGAAIAGAAVLGTKQLMAEDAAMKAVQNTLKSTGNAAGTTAEAINKTAVAIQRQTGYADDALIGMQNLLLTFTKISNSGPDKIFDRATQATVDLAKQFGKSLPTAAVMVGKALNDPVKGITALGRAGIQFTADQKATIKSLAETGRVAEAQKLILKELETQVGGAGKAFGKSLPGQVEILKREFEDMTQEVAVALLPAFKELLPAIRDITKAIGPVLASLGASFAKVVTTLANSKGVREFASAVSDGLTSALNGLAGAASIAAQALGPMLGGIATIGRSVLGSAAGITILTAALGAFVATKAAAYAMTLARSFMALAAVQAVAPGLAMLGSSLSTLTMGLTRTSAASLGLAPGLTAAQAGITRMGLAAGTARAGLATLGTGLTAALGGPVGIAIGAVGALAFVIGGDLVRSFFGGKSAADIYAEAQRNATAATDALRNSTALMVGAIAGVAQAENAENSARNAATAATRAKTQALAAYGPKSAEYKRAVDNEKRANTDLASAMANTDGARQRSKQSVQDQIGSIIKTGDSIRTLAARSRGELAGVPPLVASGSKAWKDYQLTVATADAKFMRTNKTVQEQQRSASRLAGELKLLGPEWSAAAAAADRLAKAKTPSQYNKALGDLTKALGGTKDEAGKASGDVNKAVGKMGAVQTAMPQVTAQVGVELDAMIAKIEAKVAEANAKLRRIGDRSSPQVAATVSANLQGVGAVVDGELANIRVQAEAGAKAINLALRRGFSFQDVIEQARTTLGSLPMETGLRDTMGEARGLGISVGPENAATADALAREVGQSQRLLDAYTKLREAKKSLGQENSKANQRAVQTALNDVREAAGKAGVGRNVKNTAQAKAALTRQTAQLGATQAVARQRAAALREAIAQQEAATKAAQVAFGKYREQVMQATDAKYNDSFRRMGDTIELIPGKFTALNKELENNLKAIEATRAALTPAEAALRALEDSVASDDLAAKVADAQTKLNEARRIGDPALISAAEKELAAAQRDTNIAELRKTAEEQRAEQDRIAAEAVTAEQARGEARRLELEAQREADRITAQDDLDRLETQMQAIPGILAGAKAPAEEELAGIVRAFGKFGKGAGENYKRYLKRSLDGLDSTIARAIATKVEPYLKLGSPAKRGPLSKLDKWFTPFTDTLMGGVDMAGMAKSSATVAGASLPGRGGAVGGTTVVVNVDGNQFDAREFARKLEPELARIVSATF
jgi:hypothetical protein